MNKIVIIFLISVFLCSYTSMAVDDISVRNGVQAWYVFYNSSSNMQGTNIVDWSGHRNATITQGFSCVPGNDYCTMASNGEITFTNFASPGTSTAMMLVNVTTTSATYGFGDSDSENTFYMSMSFPSANRIGTGNNGATSSTAIIITGLWAFIARQDSLSHIEHYNYSTNISSDVVGGTDVINTAQIGRSAGIAMTGKYYVAALVNRSWNDSELAYVESKLLANKSWNPYLSITTNYTVVGTVSYNNSAISNANVSLLSDYGQSVLATTQSNSTGGYVFSDLINDTYYTVLSTYNHSYTASGYVYMNDSTPITKNLDFYSSGTTTTTVYPSCFIFSSGCYASSSLTSNNCALVSR